MPIKKNNTKKCGTNFENLTTNFVIKNVKVFQ